MAMTLIALAYYPGHVGAQQKELPCVDVKISPQVHECTLAKYKSADSILNETYKQLMAKIASDYKNLPKQGEEFRLAVKKAQQAWLKFMETNCAVEAFDIEPDTSAYQNTVTGCRMEMTVRRVTELQNLLRQP